MSQPARPEAPEINPVMWWSTIAGICAIIIFGSVFVTWSYLKKRDEEIADPRPAYLSKLTDFTAVNRDGKEVSFSDLEGKIWVAGYQYTDCPGGCLGMAAVMKALQEKLGDRDDFHLVSISLNPSDDTPEKMDAWVKRVGIDAKNWWFLTGDEQGIRDYMIRNFKFFGVVENTDPAIIATEGKFSHDQRLALVDGDGHVRGMYDVMNPQFGAMHLERLGTDLRYLFREVGRPLADEVSEATPGTTKPE
ncbi:MAG: SCO family protein [Verrucomicrobiae bacterium]|nr:SCO family protein [Verrucomicrobiae bacterium]